MKKRNINKAKKFLSLALLLTISFNQVSFCMQTIEDNTEKIDNKSLEKQDIQKINASELCDDIFENIFELLSLKDLKNIGMVSKNFNELFVKYMQDPSLDSSREIYVDLELKNKDISLFKNISKNFEQAQNKLKKFIGNSNRKASLKLTNPFTNQKSINLNKENIAKLEKILLQYYSINKKNKNISLTKKYLTIELFAITAFVLSFITPIILCNNLDIKNIYKYLIVITSFALLEATSMPVVDSLDKKINRLKYDLSMTDPINMHQAAARTELLQGFGTQLAFA